MKKSVADVHKKIQIDYCDINTITHDPYNCDSDVDDIAHDDEPFTDVTKCIYDVDQDGDDDDDDDDDNTDIIEEMMFALQKEYFFIKRIHGHRAVRVYKAIHRDSLVVCCLKFVVRSGITNIIERLPIEVRILSHIKNKFEIQRPEIWKMLQHLIAYHYNEYGYVIVSEFVNEASFRRYLAPHPENVKKIMRDLISVTDALHDAGIIYRDFKSSNLMYDEQNITVTVIDFDLATYSTKTHSVVLGTNGFFAPELAAFDASSMYYTKNCKKYDSKIDVYSLGVVFGCLLFNVSEADVDEYIVKSWKKTIKKKKIRSAAHELLMSMLIFDPLLRPAACDLLNHMYFKDIQL